MVFLLSVASAGRHCELHALVIDPKYIHFNPRARLNNIFFYFNLKFMHKNQKPTQTNDPVYSPAVPTGTRFMTEHSELCKGRRRFKDSFKDNNYVGKRMAP